MLMKKIILLLLLGLPVWGVSQVTALEQNYIEVYADAQQSLFPDQLYFSFWFPDGEGSTLEKRVAKLKVYLEKEGLPASVLLESGKIQSELPLVYSWRNNAQQFFLLFPGIDRIAETEEYLTEIGAENWKFEFAEHSQREAIRGKLYAQVMERAMQSAKLLLSPAGKQVGPVIFVQEINSAPTGRLQSLKFGSSREKVMGVTRQELSFSPMLLKVEAKVRFEIR